SCSGTVDDNALIDTSSVGEHSFTVNAADNVGNPASRTTTYIVSYGIVAMYDQAKTHQSGSTIPVKLQLVDHSKRNMSAAAITVTPLEVVKLSDDTSGVAAPPSSAVADSNFRYDTTLGGYIYNLRTTGLSTGTYELHFRAANDPTVQTVNFQIR
ncbi:MAG: hypothetical protein AVDCRST_MAG93-9230, partial [uncultured Chloroflexia bacterium]